MEALESSSVGRRRGEHAYWTGRIFTAAWVGYAGLYLCRRNIAWTPLPELPHLAWINNLAWLLIVFGTGYMAGQIAGGWAADRFGGRRTLLAGGLIALLSTALLVVPAPAAVVMSLELLNGFGQGLGWPSVMKLVAVWFPRSQIATVVAWFSTSYALGSFLASALATALSMLDGDSRFARLHPAILAPSGLLLLTSLYFYLRVRDLPSAAGLEPLTGKALTGKALTGKALTGKAMTGLPGRSIALVSASSSRDGWSQILRNPEIQLQAVIYFFLKLTRYALLFWLPLYIIETQRLHGTSALTLSSLFELTGFLGAVVGAYGSDRWFGSRRYPMAAAMLFLSALVFLVHPLVSGWGTVPTGISIALIGILIFGPDVLVSSIAVIEAVGPEQVGRASGYVNAVGSLGQVVSPLLVSLLSQIFGWNSIFTLFMVCSLAAASLLTLRWNAPAKTMLQTGSA